MVLNNRSLFGRSSPVSIPNGNRTDSRRRRCAPHDLSVAVQFGPVSEQTRPSIRCLSTDLAAIVKPMSLWARVVCALYLGISTVATTGGCVGEEPRSPAADRAASPRPSARQSVRPSQPEDRAGKRACDTVKDSSLSFLTANSFDDRSTERIVEKISDEGQFSRSLGISSTAREIGRIWDDGTKASHDERSRLADALESKLDHLEFECGRAGL